MMRYVAGATRAGEDGGQAVLRAYLPAVAGHNLIMATELVLTQRVGASAGSTVADATPTNPLLRTVTLRFSGETLQRALELLAEEAGLTLAIDGAALQAEGITQNQTLALDEQDQPAGEVLLKILLAANPDRSARGPGDPRQRLVYVDGPGPGLVVTTRATAQQAGQKLPAVFDGPAD
ncbi:MAG TPA: hypothetical protein PKC18_03360 [Lacipirellulaceae bacterium]|nr:hypothetical protein [Lacipirellulaceae bacterium]